MSLTYVKPERIWLKDHSELSEAWLRDRIVEDPTILGLGDVEIKAVEKIQPQGGRLDLLMFDPETEKRYEVELMLGTVDESHIIRSIEYWDVERKRYPQYDHTAVLVAENITTRFLNVIGLFNSAIPLVAIQLNALKIGDSVVLNFTKVLDEVIPGDDDEEGDDGIADRAYWEKKGSKGALLAADECEKILREINPTISLSYKHIYIGLTENGQANNFVVFYAKKHFVRVEGKVRDKEPWREKMDAAGIVAVGGAEHKRLRFRLTKEEAERNHSLLKDFFAACHTESQD